MLGFTDFNSETKDLLKEVNSYENVQVSQLEDLSSGLIISQIISFGQTRQDFLKLVSSGSSISIPQRWKLIQDYMKLNYLWTLDEYHSDEITKDKGVLYLLTKSIIKSLGRVKKPLHRRITSHTTALRSNLGKSSPGSLNSINHPSSLSSNSSIFSILQDLRLIPFGTLVHEFLHRAKTGLNLFEIIKKLDPNYKNIDGLQMKPESLDECLKNIQKILKFLRKFTKIDKNSLFISEKIVEGDQETVFSLLGLLYEEYIKNKAEKKSRNLLSNSRSTDFHSTFASASSAKSLMEPVHPSEDSSKPLHSKSANTISIKPQKKLLEKTLKKNLSTSEKYSVIDWISSIGLLDRLVASENPLKSSLDNGVLLCQVLVKVYLIRLRYFKAPKNYSEVESNFLQALKFLEGKLSFPYFSSVSMDEDFTFEVLFAIMNTCKERAGIIDPGLFKETESSLMAWLQSGGLINDSQYSVFSIIPEIQSGQLLVKIVNCLVESFEKVAVVHDPIQNITSCLQVLQKKALMNQRYTSCIYEIFRGETFIIISFLEDLQDFASKSKKTLKILPSRPFSNFDLKKLKNLEFWLVSKGIQVKTLAGEELKDFRSGEKLAEIVTKVFGSDLQVINSPKKRAEVLWNIRQSLDFLYSLHDFPIKYKYLDDLLAAGDGETIRNLITDMMQII